MFECLDALPADPILDLLNQYQQDTNTSKVDLGVGVYKNEQNQTPIMQAVKKAEEYILSVETSKSYIGPAGTEGYAKHISQLLFGKDNSLIKEKRLSIAQTPGGCGALKVAADLIKSASTNNRILVSTPTWANHIPLLKSAGLKVGSYPYYDYSQKKIRFDAMCETLIAARAGDIVLLHGCCHNPSGADLSEEQWDSLARLIVEKNLVPFIDIAYQGLGKGLNEDAYGVRLLASKVPEMLIASSCSKNFGLYRERTGTLFILSDSEKQAKISASNLFSVIRTNYSMPPSHGAAIVETILSRKSLYNQWQDELKTMRDRILYLRFQLSDRINSIGCSQDFSFIPNQKGMFSFLGITENQVARLKQDYSIYMTNNSRINIAGLSSKNLPYVANAICEVVNKDS